MSGTDLSVSRTITGHRNLPASGVRGTSTGFMDARPWRRLTGTHQRLELPSTRPARGTTPGAPGTSQGSVADNRWAVPQRIGQWDMAPLSDPLR